MDVLTDELRREARRLAERVAALPEPAMRHAVLVETFAALRPAHGAAILAVWLSVARDGADPPLLVALTALAGILGEPARLPYPARAALYAAAKAGDARDVVALLLGGSASPPEDEPPPPEPERPLLPSGRPLTLGERKALARGPLGRHLSRLLVDPDDQVIRVLLENPHLTERDVITIATRRPTRGAVLRTIFASRWLLRAAVKRALVKNPYTPGILAAALLPTLPRAELTALAHDASLSPPLRAAARELAAPVGATSWSTPT